MNCSLTAPSDRDPNAPTTLNQNAPPLTDVELSAAMKELNVKVDFPQIERRFIDPPIEGQKIALVSFVPAKGATPNQDGIYAFAKIRGVYPDENASDERASFLIRNVDSYHPIFHPPVGHPFPIISSSTASNFSKTVNRVDLKKAVSSAYNEEVKRLREREQNDIKQIKEREENLLSESKREEEDPLDRYTTLKVKKAQLLWTIKSTEEKMQQMIGLACKARYEIEEMDRENPELAKTYYDKYMQARRDAGLSTDQVANDTSFMKFLSEDFHLPALEAEFNRIYGSNS